MYETLLYEARDRVARITLNRPGRLNAIDTRLPGELRDAVLRADDDDGVHVILLSGAGRAFCAGYDLKAFAEDTEDRFTQEMPWDPMQDYRFMRACTDAWMTLFRCHKPTVARVHGYAVAGGSDIALCCDLLVMAEDAQIGYPPARVWGCPTTAMWAYRVGAQQAKRLMFTGNLVDGPEAVRIGLALEAPPPDKLDERVEALVGRMVGVPRSQLMMHKLVINQTLDSAGLQGSQLLATVFDGITRHSPEGLWFKRFAEERGFQEAVRYRDSGAPIPQGDEARCGGGLKDPGEEG
jgi:enoyl-CoA hydratase